MVPCLVVLLIGRFKFELVSPSLRLKTTLRVTAKNRVGIELSCRKKPPYGRQESGDLCSGSDGNRTSPATTPENRENIG